MKTLPILFAFIAFVGCTTAPTNTVDNRPSQRELSEKRVHTQAELQKTGRPELGDALQTVDPSVTVSHGR
jgi:hypothetical protein